MAPKGFAVLACLAGGMVYLAAGCPKPPGPVKLEPTQLPPTFIAVAPGQTQKTSQFLSGSKLYLRVMDAATGLRVPKAAIGLVGPTLAGGLSGATYDLTFGPLGAGTYRLRISAPGYVTREQEVAIASRPTTGQKTPDTSLEVTLQPGAGAIGGRIVNPAGQPIAGARITAGANLAFSSGDGSFGLDGLAPGKYDVEIRKTGYAPVSSAAVAVGANVGSVAMSPTPVVVNFANASTVFGNQAASSVLRGLEDALRAAGATVKENDAAGATIQIFAAPGPDIASKVAEVAQWTADGGKLVVLGEWGGLSGYSPEAAEGLLHPAGLAIESDLVRSGRNAGQADWPLGVAVSPWPWGNSEIAVFQAASVFAVPPAQVVTRVPEGFRIAAVSIRDPVLAAVSSLGGGLVAAVGDTSAWSDSNTTGTGPDLGYKDNRSYVVNLILW